ncbi:MAG TPA: hypothetical protein VFF02_14270 [Anaeromyxobacteraceae bacterium]|nr:hypothetical protein [Anaeromyxobacteraceae bacterium]
MPRRIPAFLAVTAAATFGAWGCQDYNFNPVGSCLIQPGSRQVRLDDVSAADILFVVDDSGSMSPKQQALASNFSVFINELSRFSVDRVAQGLSAFDYHIAVTTSSVFRNYRWGDCQTTTQGERCCNPATCTAGNACTVGIEDGTCIGGSAGGTFCCVTPSVCDQGAVAHGQYCGRFATNFEDPLHAGGSYECQVAGLASPGAAYPQGNFVAAGSNPKVLHFANLFTGCTVPSPACTPNTQCGTNKMCYGGTGTTAVCCDDKSATLTTLENQFQQNIQVGCAGSGEEQHLEAARLALQKALAGQQPGVAPGEWPHGNSKLVVVWVADEDDCSNPANPATAIVLSGSPGNDTCVDNQNPLGQAVEYPVADYTSFFGSLGRPFGGAFIVSATPVPCSFGTCTPNTCDGGGGLVGYSPAVRLLGVAGGLTGASPVEGSVCAPFANTLLSIANLVTSPPTLRLDSVPATSDITLVRIASSSSGATRRICTQATTQAEADTHTFGWWFYDCANLSSPPPVSTIPTQCIFIDHLSGQCEANPGETYSAEYLGQMPPGGCPSPSSTPAPSQFCAEALLGPTAGPADWSSYWCYGTAAPGTCVCQ